MKSKKVLTALLSVAVCSSMATLCMPTTTLAAELPSEKPTLKIGVASDQQIKDDAECESFKRALQDFKEQKVDVVMLAGDITDNGELASYKLAYDAWKEVFPDEKTAPIKAWIMGNHDYKADNCNGNAECEARFMEQFELTGEDGYIASGDFHKVINGYHLIGASSGWDIPAEKQQWLDQEIQKAEDAQHEAGTDGQPIYVMCHPHAQNTCYGSADEDGGWSDKTINNVLKKYENVIYLSGHSHFAAEDERIIYQKDYTALNTAGTAYTELEAGTNGKVNGSIPWTHYKTGRYRDADEYCEGYIVNNYPNQVIIQRRCYTGTKDTWTIRDVKKDDPSHNLYNNFTVKVPVKKDEFQYTDEARRAYRMKDENKPTFANDAKVEVTSVSKRAVSVKFPAGSHFDFVHHYQVDAYNTKTGNVDKTLKYFSDFYLGIDRMSVNEFASDLVGLDKGTDYEIRVYAVDSYENKSKPIIAKVTTDTNPNADKPYEADILNLDMSAGDINSVKDASSNKSAVKVNGTVKMTKDEDTNKNVLDMNGNGYLSITLNDEQRKAMASEFTVEAVVKSNSSSVNMGVVSNNINNNGMSLTMNKGRVTFNYNTDKDDSTENIGGRKSITDNYHQILAVYDGLKVNLYYDGKEITSRQIDGNLVFNNTSDLIVGGELSADGTVSSLFDGKIEAVKVYSNGLYKDQITTIYNMYANNDDSSKPEDSTSENSTVTDSTESSSDETSTKTETSTSKVTVSDSQSTSKSSSTSSTDKKEKSPITGYAGVGTAVATAALAGAIGITYFKSKKKSK